MINANTGDNAINIIPGAAGTLNSSDIDNNLKAIEKSDIFLTQLETPYDVTSYALQKAKDTGSITILNPAPASKISENDFKNIDYFTPNETEASFYLEKKIETKSEIENAAKEFLKKGVKNILITLGSKGVYFSNGTESHFVDALKLKDEVKATTGAGDAFNGAFACAIICSSSSFEALGILLQIDLNVLKFTPSLERTSKAVLLTPSLAILMLCFSATFGDIFKLFKLLFNSLILLTFFVKIPAL